MGKIPFVADSYRGAMPINWMPIVDEQRGHILVRTPGFATALTVGEAEALERYVIGMLPVGDYIYVAAQADTFPNTTGYSGDVPANLVIVAYTAALVDTGLTWAINADPNAPMLQMEACTSDLVVCDGTSVWALKRNTPYTVTKQTAFSASSIATADGYAIASVKDSGLFRISSLNDFFTWADLDYGTAEGDIDNILRILVDHRELWAFGEKTTEVYYNSGAADFPYARAAGGFIEHGTAAALSPAKLDNQIYWLSHERVVMRAQGYQPQIVSNRKLDRILQDMSVVSDAVGWGMTYNGHGLYWLTFPTEKKTYVYDASTNLWHQRSYYNGWRKSSILRY